MAGNAAGEQFRVGMIQRFEVVVEGLKNTYNDHVVHNKKMVHDYEAQHYDRQRERYTKSEEAERVLCDTQEHNIGTRLPTRLQR